MKVVRNIAKMQELSRQARSAGLTVGFVPTMGFLHEGHLALVEHARRNADVVVVSIFVNPTQFDRRDDFEAYPRDAKTDHAMLAEAGVDILLEPDAADVYPDGAVTKVSVAHLTTGLCGAHRPGHFDGVATVVTSLLHMVGPDFAVFGEKDFQQLQVIRRLVRDLHFPVRIDAVPTVREIDGLAMSSRNARLNDHQRELAPSIHRALLAAAVAYRDGERDPDRLRAVVAAVLAEAPEIRVEYLEFVSASTLAAQTTADCETVLAVAAFLGDVRLIDNIPLERTATELGADPFVQGAMNHA
jgi:pantoate--beta-alanine ligase